MLYSLFKKLRTFLIRTFEKHLLAGERDKALQLIDTMARVTDFLRGSAAFPPQACMSAAKGKSAGHFKKLLNDNGIDIA